MMTSKLTATCLLGVAIHGVATKSGSSDPRGPVREQPQTDHAVGFYDARLRRVVLVGAPGDPKHGDLDKVWSWSGERWEPSAGAGPQGRVNAAAAYDTGRERAVVAGGSRKTGEGGRWEVVGDAWESDGSGWQRIPDIAPRDHHSLVEDGRGGLLMFGGIPADRGRAWPAET
jgi:hypothetical protein